jgi:hypothetical protein
MCHPSTTWMVNNNHRHVFIMIDKFQKIIGTLKYCASADTAYGEYEPEKYGELHNHCGCVAYVIQQMFGGSIRTGKVHGVKHYWNDIGGMEVDCSASQFGQTDIVFFPCENGKDAPTRKTINPRFQKFWDRVQETLHK